MGAVWLVFGVKLRRHWRSWLLLTVLIAVVSGFVLAATAAGDRTDSAFPRYVARHGYDAIVYAVQPLPGLAKLPGVAQVTTVNLPFAGQPRCSCGHQISYGEFAVREVPAAALDRAVKLVAGRMPDQSSQVEALASYTLQRDYGVHPGTVITVPLAGASQREAVFKALAGGPVPKPEGPVIAVRVTGIVAAENEFPSGGGPSYDLYPTTAFATATRDTSALPTYQVRLRHGLADLARFEAVASHNGAVGVEDLDRPAAAITSSIHPQAVGWRVLAALAGLAGLAVAGQALARQTAAESADHPALAALGLSPRQLVAVSMMRTLATAVAGAAGGIAVATLLSPLAPAGEARLADPAPGLSFDAAVLGLGALATVAVVLVLGVLAFPGDFTTGGLGTGAAMTTPGYVAAQCPPGPKQAACLKQAGKRIPDLVVIHAVDGPAGQAALDHYGGKQDDNATRPVIPAALVNFGESANFPLLLGGIVTLCGLATLGHLLVVSVARRRTENGLLRALGMVRRQLASVMFWQASAVAVVAIGLGIPIGIAAGQAIWRAFAVSLGVVPAPVVHAWPLAAIAAGVLITANALAAIPALSAARSGPGRVPRTE